MRGRRLGGILAVALLHLALGWALLTYSRQAAEKPQAVVEREIFFYVPPRPHPAQQRNARQEPSANPSSAPAAPMLPDYRGITMPDSQNAPTLGLNRSLFGCSPQEMANLSPQERARCANAMSPDDSVDYRDGTSRSRSAALWERGRQRKNAPLLLPCMSPNAPPSLGTILCLANGAVNGLDLDSQPSYADKPEQSHLPNNGDPPDKPTYGP
jgi:hypothetical protein